MSYDEGLAAPVRPILADRTDVVEKKLFVASASWSTVRCVVAAPRPTSWCASVTPTTTRRSENPDERADRGERLLDLKRKHFVFPAVFNPLLERLDYATGGDAIRWWPRGKETPIVLDPTRAFGAAIAETIAKWFRVDMDEARAAIAFEKSPRRSTPSV